MLPRRRGQPAAQRRVARDAPPEGSYLSSAEEPRRARMMSLVRSSVGPGGGGGMVSTVAWSPPWCEALLVTMPWLPLCHGAVVTIVPWLPPCHRTEVTTTLWWPSGCDVTTPWMSTTPQHRGHLHATSTTVP